MRTKLLMLFAVLGLMLSQSIYAQSKIVTGTVTDASTGETLPGVNVIIKNTTTGTSTYLFWKTTDHCSSRAGVGIQLSGIRQL